MICIKGKKQPCLCTSYNIIINYCLKSEISVTFHFQPGSTHYTAVWINNCLKNTSVNKVATTNDFRYERKPSFATTKLILFAISKDEWNTPLCRMHALQYFKRRHWSDLEQWKDLGRKLKFVLFRGPCPLLLYYVHDILYTQFMHIHMQYASA